MPQEKKSAQSLLTQQIKTLQEASKPPPQQIRTGVSKDLWITDEALGRLHHHIESPHSILTIYNHGNRLELIEKMEGMKCYLQEKIESDADTFIQQIRFIESTEGTYHYSDHHFNAPSVFLALFRIPGQTLFTDLKLEQAFLKGIAQNVSLSFAEDRPNFHAQKFKAHILPQRNTL